MHAQPPPSPSPEHAPPRSETETEHEAPEVETPEPNAIVGLSTGQQFAVLDDYETVRDLVEGEPDQWMNLNVRVQISGGAGETDLGFIRLLELSPPRHDYARAAIYGRAVAYVLEYVAK